MTVHPDAAQLAPTPVAVGRYRIVRTIGTGLMGGVHLAVRDRQYWAVRLLDDAVVRRLPAASRLHGDALDQHLVSYREIGTDPDVGAFIASDPVEGVPITGPDATPTDPRTVASLLIPIFEALHLLHVAGGVHGTIKPSNLLVRRGGKALLVDAGLAYAATPAQRPKLLSKAYPHLAPEVVEAYETGLPERIIAALTPAADVYAAGLLTAEVLSGRVVFAPGRDARELVQRKRGSKVLIYGLGGLSTSALTQAVGIATASDPARRLRGLGDLIVALSNLNPAQES